MSLLMGEDNKKTPLYDLHVDLGAKMVPFGGYHMPLNYPLGVLGEHKHTRVEAGLFDVSHMGQVRISGEDADSALEMLVPADIKGLRLNNLRYTVFTNVSGGVLDDLIVTRREKHLDLVVNASRQEVDLCHLKERLRTPCTVERMSEHALIALQGPSAARVLARHIPKVEKLRFMSAITLDSGAMSGVSVSRSGYTGEDGFEISLPSAKTEAMWTTLLSEPEVTAVGLAARDSLRLEAGLCLYGHELNEGTTPVEANLSWTIGKRRRTEGGFIGDTTILTQLKEGSERLLVGILPLDRAPAREGAEIHDDNGNTIGLVTSGGYGPSIGGPIAMGYVDTKNSAVQTSLALKVRNRRLAAKVVELPFVPHRYCK